MGYPWFQKRDIEYSRKSIIIKTFLNSHKNHSRIKYSRDFRSFAQKILIKWPKWQENSNQQESEFYLLDARLWRLFFVKMVIVENFSFPESSFVLDLNNWWWLITIRHSVVWYQRIRALLNCILGQLYL